MNKSDANELWEQLIGSKGLGKSHDAKDDAIDLLAAIAAFDFYRRQQETGPTIEQKIAPHLRAEDSRPMQLLRPVIQKLTARLCRRWAP